MCVCAHACMHVCVCVHNLNEGEGFAFVFFPPDFYPSLWLFIIIMLRNRTELDSVCTRVGTKVSGPTKKGLSDMNEILHTYAFWMVTKVGDYRNNNYGVIDH